MKPSLGRKVYTIYDNEIYEELVGYIGESSFIVEDFSELRSFDSLEYYYTDYGVTWFTSLTAAKQAMRKSYGKMKIKIVRKYDDVWEAIEA